MSCKVVTKNVTPSAKDDSPGHFLDRIFYIIMITIFSGEISHNNTDVKSLKKSISRFRNSCFDQRKKLWRKRKVENSVIGLRSSKSRMNVSTENMCVFGTSWKKFSWNPRTHPTISLKRSLSFLSQDFTTLSSHPTMPWEKTGS